MKVTHQSNEMLSRREDPRCCDPLDLLAGIADNALYDIYAATIADELMRLGEVELAQVFLLEWDGLNDSEIGAKLGIHRHTVRKRKKLVLVYLENRRTK